MPRQLRVLLSRKRILDGRAIPPMRLSVIMAVRNGKRFVSEAIESVLAQSVTDFEFLIVDDGSTDGTSRILSEYRRRDSRICVLHNQDNLGPYPSANLALMRARGRFVARHDADDISPPERFAIQLATLESEPETVLVTGAVERFGTDGGQANTIARPHPWQPRLEWDLLFGNVIGAGAHVMFPRVLHGTPVLFPLKHPYAEDYGLWCRLCRLGQVACPAQVIYRYRRHGGSITSLKRAEQQACLSKIRYEYQSQYLRPTVSPDSATAMVRFWIADDGNRPLGGTVPMINAILIELRSNFAAYVEQRYGLFARRTLAAEIDDVLNDRLAYWLYRSMRLLDGNACNDLLVLARATGNTMRISRNVLGLLAHIIHE
jgi:glycosyltransferase involved in cell wall biosynthesis